MRRFILFITLLTGFVNIAQSQSFINVFDKAYIVSDNDTLACFVKIQGSYNKTVTYKHQIDGIELRAKVDTINYVITDYNVFGKVKYKRQQILARILSYGKINYYLYLTHTYPKGNMDKGWVSEEDIQTFYIEKGGVCIKISSNTISNEIKALFRDNEDIFNRISATKLKRDDLPDLIEEYNSKKE